MRVPGLSLAGGLSERLKSWVMGSREAIQLYRVV